MKDAENTPSQGIDDSNNDKYAIINFRVDKSKMFVRLSKLARLELKLQAIYVSSLKGLIVSF
jgi:hypothetical protein